MSFPQQELTCADPGGCPVAVSVTGWRTTAMEVLVLFGDRYPSGRGTWPLTGPGVRSLYQGPGRELIDAIAAEIGAVVE